MKKIRRIDITPEELKAFLYRMEVRAEREDYDLLAAIVGNYEFVLLLLQGKNITIERLKNMIFGATTEKTEKVRDALGKEGAVGSGVKSGKEDAREGKEKKKRKGHGRNGASAYTGAIKIGVPHKDLKAGDSCPDCTGILYDGKVPGVVVRITAQAPLQATVYELEKVRCCLCGKVFTAAAPEGIGEDKYDEKSGSMIALLKYGSGLPFNRLANLQGSLGIPLPASTQWEVVEGVADRIHPVFTELKHIAAQGEVIHNDDTGMKILDLMGPAGDTGDNRNKGDPDRKGIFTTGIISINSDRKIALFFTGRKHAGENLYDLLVKREEDLGPPIQMCDALSRNAPKEFKRLLANCNAHGRRKFVEVSYNFPEECLHVLEVLKEVYKNDAIAKEQNMSLQERLEYHQAESGPLMDNLHEWFKEQFDQKKVEPNSGLGQAISYMLNHWEALTLFLREPGSPLDNNICERALKKAILHRKNSLFFKTEHGAYIGDLFMSLIHTCNLCGANPFDYLTELQKHSVEVFKAPGDWLPWNYRKGISSMAG